MRSLIAILVFFLTVCTVQAQDHHGHNHDHGHEGHTHAKKHADKKDHGHDAHATDHGAHHANACGDAVDHEFNVGETAFHHVADQNVYNIGPLQLPLPCIVYSKEDGLSTFSSGVFHADAHGTSEIAYDRYVLHHGMIHRIKDGNFPKGEVELGHHAVYKLTMNEGDKEVEKVFVCHNGSKYEAEGQTTLDAGYFGGAGFNSSFYDFSMTKNVVSMIIVFLILAFLFTRIARAYRDREGLAPKGAQSLIEPIILFIRDEVAIPFMGEKYMRFFPFLLAIFFFILGLNLWGQIPFLGGSNVTGNLAFTGALAVVTFFVVNLSGNKHYWEHTLWMPGVPAIVKILVLTPVEIAGLIIKPLTLMLRLASNITAGHIVITVFISLIFIFGKSGELPMVAGGTSIGSTLLTMFMMAIELLVAFIQAFVFTILTASYLGAATEEAHH